MKPCLSLALLALAASLASAEGFDHQSFTGSANFILANFTHNGFPSQALLLNGSVQAIFLPSNGTLSLTTDEVLIADSLRSYYLSRNHSLSSLSLLSSVHEGIAAIRGNRLPGEERCRVLIGTDNNPCIDFFSCQQACYSVTSFCLPVALGSGRVFVNEVWLFENRSLELSSAYSEEEGAYAALSQNATRQAIERYMASLSGVNRAATAAAKSALFDAYSYCALPDYSLTQITALQLDARRIQQNASKLLYLESEATLVRSRTLAGLERLLSEAANSSKGGENGTHAAEQQPEEEWQSQQSEEESGQAAGNSPSGAQGGQHSGAEGSAQGQQPGNGSAATSPELQQGENASGIQQMPSPSDTSRRSVVFIAVAAVLLFTAVLALAAGSRHNERQRHKRV